jgi:hypothetical protein
MSKNRKIADLLDDNGDVKLTNLDNIDLTNLNASHLTSGSIPDARVPSSAVSQHATSFDDNKIVNDISTLALRQASNENKSAYNTNSMYVDVFQDSTGITNLTNSVLNGSEYMEAVAYGTLEYKNYSSIVSSSGSIFTPTLANFTDNDRTTSGMTSNAGNTTGVITLDLGQIMKISAYRVGKAKGYGDITQITAKYSTTNSAGTDNNFDWTGASATLESSTNYGSGVTLSNFASDGTFSLSQIGSGYQTGNSMHEITGFTPFQARYINVQPTQADFVDANYTFSEWAPKAQTLAVSATGSFENNAITAPSSVSSMGAIITYQDNAGTNALNTDIVLKLSADGGSNYATATLTAMPNFSSGVKMAKVNDLAVTAGTSLKYKIEFANQASGSKEARIRGVSLQY